MAPTQQSEIKKLVQSTESKVHSLKAAIFHTMAYKMSLEINKGDITLPTRRSFLKVLYNVCQIRKKDITFEQYYRIHVHGPKIAICEITSDTVFVLNSAFTAKDNYFRVAIDEAIDAFNAVLLDFGYTQQLQKYDPTTHQVHPQPKHPFWPNHHTSAKSTWSTLTHLHFFKLLLLDDFTFSNCCFSMTSLSPIAASRWLHFLQLLLLDDFTSSIF